MTAGIHYLQGDATQPVGPGPKIIAHICNDEGKWGAGFVLAISRKWETPELEYRRWFRSERKPQLGEVQFVQVEDDICVANMVAQHGIRRRPTGAPPIRYEAVREALKSVADRAATSSAAVHMPRIGTGLAGGNWTQIEPIILETLVARDIPVSVYDFPAARTRP